ENFRTRNSLRQFATKLTRQLPHSITQAHQNCFAALIDFAAGVIERVHRSVCEDEEITFPINARQNMLEHAREIVKIDRRVRKQQKLRQGKLALDRKSTRLNS